jgi:predicted membrane-bound spermidine synthase
MARGGGHNKEPATGATLALVIAATGFTGMALELILIFMFQSLLGYIYASIGCLIAMFMLGLAGGAFIIKKYFQLPALYRWRILLALEALFVLIALALPLVMKTGEIIPAGWPMAALIYLLTLLTGGAGGAQFVLAINLMDRTAGPEAPALPMMTDLNKGRATASPPCRLNDKIGMARQAALLNAADLTGAALGSLLIGVMFLPLFGFAETCYILAMLKTGTMAFLSVVYFNIRPLVSQR